MGLRRQELIAASILFVGLSFAIFGWYVFEGGFIADDWVNADRYYFHPEPGFWGAVENYQTPSRPVAAVYVSLTYAVLGTDFAAHLVLAVLLAAFLSIAFFAFLRALGLHWALAFAAAALLLVFPMSDSTRFWSTGSQINLFIGLYLIAVVIAIAGIRRFGSAAAVPALLTQVLASALAVTAVAGYEIVAPAVLLSLFVYRWIGASWRGATWRWLLDAIPTLLVLFFFTREFGDGPGSLDALLTNVRLAADGAVSVLGYSLYPMREMPRWTVLAGVVAIVLATLLARRVPLVRPDREAIGRWLPLMLLAIAGIAIGYAMIIPAADRYPLYAPGVQNRVNCFAALGISALTVFLLAAIASMLVALVPRAREETKRKWRWGLTGFLVFIVFSAYLVRITEDGHRWANAAKVQAEVLEESHQLLPSPPADSTIFTSPYPGYSSPSLPIFGGGGNNDQLGAFKVSYGSDELRAFPLLEGVDVICGPTSMETPDAGNSETDYGKAILVDFRARAVYRPMSQRECVKYTDAMMPFGPINLSDEW